MSAPILDDDDLVLIERPAPGVVLRIDSVGTTVGTFHSHHPGLDVPARRRSLVDVAAVLFVPLVVLLHRCPLRVVLVLLVALVAAGVAVSL